MTSFLNCICYYNINLNLRIKIWGMFNMTIYLDVVFIENLVMNLSIILSEAVLLNSLNKLVRKICSALIATAYYILTLIFPKTTYFQILVGILIILIAFRPKSLQLLLKQTFLFYFINFVFAGTSFALMCAFNKDKFSIFNGVVVGNFNVFKVFLAGIIAIIMLIYFFRKRSKHVFKDVVISISGKVKEIRLLLDTGNLLREPYTGKPVMIVEKNALKSVIDGDLFNDLDEMLKGKETIPDGMFLIPYRSLGNSSGFLLGIKPDFVALKKNGKKFYNVVIGICDENISETKSYSGIFGLETLDEGVCEI